jgi:predicted RNA binding protein YcfA (HicA-like mRNA interferase family)
LSPRLPALTAHEILNILERHGFERVRGRGLLRQIMRDANLAVDDLSK